MNKFLNFLVNIGINKASVETFGGNLVGPTIALNSTNAAGYMEPNSIQFNFADGEWRDRTYA